MQKYVATMIYVPAVKRLLMVKKQRGPENIIGYWNLMGGKVKPFENEIDAHRREANEECGIDLDRAVAGNQINLTTSRYDVNFQIFTLDFGGAPVVPTTNDVGEYLRWVMLSDFYGKWPEKMGPHADLKWVVPYLLQDGYARGRVYV